MTFVCLSWDHPHLRNAIIGEFETRDAVRGVSDLLAASKNKNFSQISQNKPQSHLQHAR